MADDQRSGRGIKPDGDLSVSWVNGSAPQSPPPPAPLPFDSLFTAPGAEQVQPPPPPNGYPSAPQVAPLPPAAQLPPQLPPQPLAPQSPAPQSLAPQSLAPLPPVAPLPSPSSRRGARALNRAPVEGAAVELGLDVAKARKILWIALALIVVLDFVGSIGAALGAPYTITRFIDGDYKVNVPTGYKTTFLLAVTVLFALLWRTGRRDGDRFTPGWALLAFVALFAWTDETIYLHQSLSEVLHHRFNTSGVLKFAWVVVYVPAAIAVFVILLRHLKALAPALRWPLLAGGGLYGGGAVLFEPVKSHFADSIGENTVQFKSVAWASDSSEMIGLTLLVVILLTELARRAGAVAVLFANVPAPRPAAVSRATVDAGAPVGGPFPGEPHPGATWPGQAGPSFPPPGQPDQFPPGQPDQFPPGYR